VKLDARMLSFLCFEESSKMRTPSCDWMLIRIPLLGAAPCLHLLLFGVRAAFSLESVLLIIFTGLWTSFCDYRHCVGPAFTHPLANFPLKRTMQPWTPSELCRQTSLIPHAVFAIDYLFNLFQAVPAEWWWFISTPSSLYSIYLWSSLNVRTHTHMSPCHRFLEPSRKTFPSTQSLPKEFFKDEIPLSMLVG